MKKVQPAKQTSALFPSHNQVVGVHKKEHKLKRPPLHFPSIGLSKKP